MLLLLKLIGLIVCGKLTTEASMAPPLQQVYTCPPSFVMLQQSTNHVHGNPGFKCYNFLENQLPYLDADLECAKLNASLATPRGRDETVVISEYVIRNLSLSSRHYWINVASDLPKENISPTAPSSGILGKIKESITRTASTPSTNQQSTCRNMLVWVVGKGDTRWIDEVCNKKAYPLCEVEVELEVDDEFNDGEYFLIPSGTNQPSEDSLDTSAPSPMEPVSEQMLARRECSLQCSSHTMRIACELRLFPEAVNQTVVLFDPKCVARENRTHLIIHTALDDCGTLAQNSDQSKVVYKNALRILGGGANDMISSTEIMKISCRYPQNNFITKGVGPSKNEMQPSSTGGRDSNSSVLQSESTISDGSSFRHIFLIYKNAEYDCPIQPYEYPYTFHVDDRLYTEIRVIVPSEQIELHAVQCFVTETQQISSVRYYLLKHGCAEDKGFKIEDSPSLKIVRMSFDLEFIFTIFTEMYIHCEMMICAVNSPNSAKCQYECSKTNKREVQDPSEVGSHSLIVTSPKILISNTTRRYTPDETKVPYIPELREDADVMTSSSSSSSWTIEATSAAVVTSSTTEVMTTTSEETTRIKKITGSVQTSDDPNKDDNKEEPKNAGQQQQLPKIPPKASPSSSEEDEDARGTAATTTTGKRTVAAGLLIIVSLHYLSEGWN